MYGLGMRFGVDVCFEVARVIASDLCSTVMHDITLHMHVQQELRVGIASVCLSVCLSAINASSSLAKEFIDFILNASNQYNLIGTSKCLWGVGVLTNPLNNEESATVGDDEMLTLISTEVINILNDIHRHCQVCSQIITYGKSVNEFQTCG